VTLLMRCCRSIKSCTNSSSSCWCSSIASRVLAPSQPRTATTGLALKTLLLPTIPVGSTQGKLLYQARRRPRRGCVQTSRCSQGGLCKPPGPANHQALQTTRFLPASRRMPCALGPASSQSQCPGSGCAGRRILQGCPGRARVYAALCRSQSVSEGSRATRSAGTGDARLRHVLEE